MGLTNSNCINLTIQQIVKLMQFALPG